MNTRPIRGFRISLACSSMLATSVPSKDISLAAIGAPFLEGLSFSVIQNQNTPVPQVKGKPIGDVEPLPVDVSTLAEVIEQMKRLPDLRLPRDQVDFYQVPEVGKEVIVPQVACTDAFNSNPHPCVNVLDVFMSNGQPAFILIGHGTRGYGIQGFLVQVQQGLKSGKLKMVIQRDINGITPLQPVDFRNVENQKYLTEFGDLITKFWPSQLSFVKVKAEAATSKPNK